LEDPSLRPGHVFATRRAAERRFESSLFEIRQLVQADLFDSVLGYARELLKHKFLRAAGAIAGVVLEKHLRQVCFDHSIMITKKSWVARPLVGRWIASLRSQ
jgi:hypothetical protein